MPAKPRPDAVMPARRDNPNNHGASPPEPSATPTRPRTTTPRAAPGGRTESLASHLTIRSPFAATVLRSDGPCDPGSPPAAPPSGGTDSHGRMDHPNEVL